MENEKKLIQSEEEVEIDLLELLYALKKKAVYLILAVIIGAAAAGAYTKVLITPLYSAKATMLVLTKETTLSSLADLQLGSELTNDYSILIRSNSVLNEVISALKLDMDDKELENSISIGNPADSRILEISVKNEDPKMAKEIVDELARTASAFIGEQMEVTPPKIIEEVEIPEDPISPNLSKNVLIGAVIGFLLSAGIVVLLTMMDDSIKSEEDIVKYLGISSLGSIPDRKDFISGKSKKKRRKEDRELEKREKRNRRKRGR